MAIEIETIPFGSYTTPEDPLKPIPVTKFTITNTTTLFSVSVIDFGAAITNLFVKDGTGAVKDVVLGFDTLLSYLGIGVLENPYFGATIGRTSNRIRSGQFVLDGEVIQLSKNDGENNLHGGFKGFDKRQWKGTITGEGEVTFTYLASDGEEGYPGRVGVSFRIRLYFDETSQEDTLLLEYRGMSMDGLSVLGMTNHSYFNLSGHENTGEKLSGHTITVNADTYTPVDSELIPTGQVVTVSGTKFDLREGLDIHEALLDDESGYDHNLCLNKEGTEEGELTLAASVETPNLTLTFRTTCPGVQFYSGNFLPTEELLRGKGGTFYMKHGAFCMETQAWPDAVNNPTFPSVTLKPGDVYQERTTWAFKSNVK